MQFYMSYAARRNITQARWYWGANSMDDVSGAWPRKDVDEFVFSKFPAPFTTDFITEQKPRLCLTLAHPVTLDDMCGPFGKKGATGTCTVALYSENAGRRCCPVYKVKV